MHMGRAIKHPAAFSIVELLVVIAILSVIVAMLLPAIAQSRATARIALCAGHLRQHGTMIAQYTLDCKDFLPMPASPHRMRTSGASLVVKDISARSSTDSTCPDGVGKTWATGFGWFFWQGYVPAITRPPYVNDKEVKLGIFDCPGSNGFRGGGMTQAQSLGSFSLVTPALAARNNNIHTAQGTNLWDCNTDGSYTGYVYRGWGKNTAAGGYAQATATASRWQPDNAVAVCSEKEDSVTLTYQDSHGNGLNILFHDGHAAFGGKDIGGNSLSINNAIKPHAYYSMKAGATYTVGMAYGNSGYAYAGGTAYVNLWKYYETNIP